MSFSDRRFAYGPFAPHYVPRQYVESYFTAYKLDQHLVLNTTVEDISRVPGTSKWKLTLRRYDPARHVDIWWHEVFDAVILANGHYAVPFVGVHSFLKRCAMLLYADKSSNRYRKSRDWKHTQPSFRAEWCIPNTTGRPSSTRPRRSSPSATRPLDMTSRPSWSQRHIFLFIIL